MKKPTLKSAKDKANAVYSRYIRLSHADSYGLVLCYTCNTRLPWKSSQCGHGITGRNNAVLYMEDVCRPQCVGCNIMGRGQIPKFQAKLVVELGKERFADLIVEAAQVVKYTIPQYQDIEAKYKEKLKEFSNLF